jgi:lipopolysaccharide/colanic/teichoic acid biosynthesis glycosyltransferase
MPLDELERTSLMFDIGELHRDRYARVKRLVDLVASVPLLVVFAVAIPLVVFGDVFGNRGRLFYVQERVGRNGKVFRIFKFRSMRSGGDESSEWTSSGDGRITTFGRFLRRSHLDELPQVLNVIRGDLSFVGPRPEQPRYVDELRDKIPYYNLRHLVSPGITGWAQVKFGYAGDETDAIEKLQYDFFYLRNQSLALDFRIIGRTIRSVLQSEGR